MSSDVIINDILPLTQIIATAGQTVFSTDWTANYPTDVVVYQTPSGDAPDDVTQILSDSDFSVAFIGSGNIVQVTLVTGANMGDTITITRQTPADRLNLYSNTNFTPTMLNQDFGILTLVDQQAQLVNQQVAPRYNYSQVLNVPVDTILPYLEPNQIWMKNSSNTAIIAVTLPGSGFAPAGDTYVLLTPDSGLPNSLALSTLTAGIMVNDVAGNTIITNSITGTTSQISVANGNGIGGSIGLSIASNPIIPGTAGMGIPEGTTGQRVTPASNIGLRYNTTIGAIEYWNGSSWVQLSSNTDVMPGLANQLAWYASTGSSVSGLTGADNGVLISGNTGIPAWLANSATPGYVLTANSGAPPSWQATGEAGAVTTLDGDSGSASPSSGVITISGGSTGLTTTGSGATLDLGGTLNVSHGGSGNTTFTAYSLVCAGTTATGAFQNVSGLGTSGQVLTSNGAAALPTWQNASGGSGITTLDGDSGSATGATVTVTGGSTGLTFSGSSATLTMGGTLDVSSGGSGDTSFTAYSVLCAGTTSTGAFQNVSGAGSSGQVLTSNGASALPTWQSVASGGAWVKISTQTASNSASITFTGLVTTYRAYVVVMSNILNATNSANLEMTYNSISSGYNYASNGFEASGTSTNGNAQGAAFLKLNTLTLDNTNSIGLSGTVWLMSPDTTTPQVATWQTFYSNSSTNFVAMTGGGINTGTTPVTSVTFNFDSGNITSGIFELYGIVA